jgi:hypothetical protein
MTVRPNSEMVLQTYRFKENAPDNSMLMQLVRGTWPGVWAKPTPRANSTSPTCCAPAVMAASSKPMPRAKGASRLTQLCRVMITSLRIPNFPAQDEL